MTGIGSPYEEPLNPEMVLPAEDCSVDACSDKLLSYLRERGYLQSPGTVDCVRSAASAGEG